MFAQMGADGKASFLALAKVASTNASFRFSLPCACSCAASSFSASCSLPLRTHCWKCRWQVWKGGCLSGSSRHCAAVSIAVALMLLGPGTFSVDARLFARRELVIPDVSTWTNSAQAVDVAPGGPEVSKTEVVASVGKD